MKQLLPFFNKKTSVAVVRLEGSIGTGGQRGLSDSGIAAVIEKAFSKGKPAAVAIEVNSPGGSPVQSSLIASRIRRLSEEKNIPVFTFVEDVAASGGYWLATAGEKIYVDAGSIVGSIGVISAGFGLTGAIEKLGVERRVHTAGESKSFLDPFSPEKDVDVARLNRMLEQLHSYFKAHITSRRGERLSDTEELFTGEIWVGQSAIDVGLADEIGHLVPVMKEKFGKDVKFRRYQRRRSLFQRTGAALSGGVLADLEERASFARFGL